jgi:hypothetical protein
MCACISIHSMVYTRFSEKGTFYLAFIRKTKKCYITCVGASMFFFFYTGHIIFFLKKACLDVCVKFYFRFFNILKYVFT